MLLPEAAYHPLAPDLKICRLLNGMWQVSGAHGQIDPQAALQDMQAYHQSGFTTWDLADHYGPAEDFIGDFRQQLVRSQGAAAVSQMQAFTKWVPRPGPMTRNVVEAAVDVSRRRMHSDTLDLLQFHWWDYQDERYLDALKHLSDLQEAGKIRYLGLTNFDTLRLEKIVAAGIRIVSNQVQFSLIDRRPLQTMTDMCRRHNIQLLTYGTLCGGFLSESYLNQPEPVAHQLTTVSQRKYKQMIDAWGGWALFQQLLQVLHRIARNHAVSLSNVAVRIILDQPTVAGVIIGTRLGRHEHRQDNARVFDISLTADDLTRLETIFPQARNLYALIGDCGDEYRRR